MECWVRLRMRQGGGEDDSESVLVEVFTWRQLGGGGGGGGGGVGGRISLSYLWRHWSRLIRRGRKDFYSMNLAIHFWTFRLNRKEYTSLKFKV